MPSFSSSYLFAINLLIRSESLLLLFGSIDFLLSLYPWTCFYCTTWILSFGSIGDSSWTGLCRLTSCMISSTLSNELSRLTLALGLCPLLTFLKLFWVASPTLDTRSKFSSIDAYELLIDVIWLLFGISFAIIDDFSLYFWPIRIRSSTASLRRFVSFILSEACPVMFVINFFLLLLTELSVPSFGLRIICFWVPPVFENFCL